MIGRKLTSKEKSQYLYEVSSVYEGGEYRIEHIELTMNGVHSYGVAVNGIIVTLTVTPRLAEQAFNDECMFYTRLNKRVHFTYSFGE